MKIAIITFILITVLCGAVLSQDKRESKHMDNQGLTCEDCHMTAEPTRRPKVDACISCHGAYADLAKLTKDIEPNIHDSHQGELRCTVCHNEHKAPVLYCNECHSFDIKPK